MTRRCEITGKKALVGNKVSHANNKTKRRYDTNLQNASLFSEVLGRSVKVRASVHGLRTIDHKGGLDAYLMATAPSKLDPALRPVKAQLMKAAERKAAAK